MISGVLKILTVGKNLFIKSLMRLNKYNEKLNTINMIVIACFILDSFYIVRGWLDCFRLREFCGENVFVKEGRGELSFLKIYNFDSQNGGQDKRV